MMAGREADIAIRRNYFEDTFLLIGEFKMLDHDMNYVLRISSFGSRSGNEQNIQVYFGLLDDTMREFTESRFIYDQNQVIMDPKRLLLRAENVELNETYSGLKVYVHTDTVTLDFLVSNDGHKNDFRSLERLEINNRVEGYAYPYCLTEGTALIGQNYSDVMGSLYYLRRFQNHPGRFDRRTGQTSILRGFSRNEADAPGQEANSLYGFFTLSDGKRISFGAFGYGNEQDHYCVLTEGNLINEHPINPIQFSVTDSPDPEDPEASPNKEVIVRVEASDDKFSLKLRRVLTLSENVSPEKKDFRIYDRFARLSGTIDGHKIHGHGCLVLT